MSWWKSSKKCPVCTKKYKKNVPFHELRVQAADGLIELEICVSCADFFDKSADVLTEKRKGSHDDNAV